MFILFIFSSVSYKDDEFVVNDNEAVGRLREHLERRLEGPST